MQNSARRYGPTVLVYCFVAIASALTEWLSFFIAGHFIGPLAAAFAAFFVATAVNYELSRAIVFLSKRPRGQEILLTFFMSAVAFLFNFATFLCCLKLLDFAPMMAKFVGTGSGFIMNYALRQFVVFSREPRFASWASLACLSRPAAESCVDHELKGGAPKPMIAPQSYPGHRILEAMRNAPHYAEAVYRMIRSALPPGTPRILDFGAGDGMFAELLLRDGLKVDCVEPDPHNQQSLASLGLSPVADIAVLEDNRYDFVYAINVLEHLHDLDRHVADLHRVLSANGRLFVFVPAFAILWTSLDDEVDHVRRFTRASLTRALGGSGLAIEKCRYFDSLGFPAALCVRALEAVGAFRYSPQTVGFYDRALLPLSLFGDRMLSNILGKNVVAIARKSVFDRT